MTDKYDPANWRSIEQICEYIYANHHYRICGKNITHQTLVNDATRTVHELPLHEPVGIKPGKAYYLSILRRLDEGEKPELTYASKHYGDQAYLPYAR